jgi:hypothetical protein
MTAAAWWFIGTVAIASVSVAGIVIACVGPLDYWKDDE